MLILVTEKRLVLEEIHIVIIIIHVYIISGHANQLKTIFASAECLSWS